MGIKSLVLVAALVVPFGCDVVPGAFGPADVTLERIEGDLSAFYGKQVRVMVVVGTEKFPATIQRSGRGAGTVTFVADSLPAGPKAVLVEVDGTTYTVKYAKTARGDAALAAQIPETSLDRSSFDLGLLTIDGDHVQAANNPFQGLVDTDQNGEFDYYDDDVDGDGLENWNDPELYTGFPDYDGYAYGDQVADVADADNDGIADWEDQDYAGGEWGSQTWAGQGYVDWAGVQDPCDVDPYSPACKARA